MISKRLLQLENDRLKEEIREKNKKIDELKMDILKYSKPTVDLNLKYMLLMTQYEKLLNSCLSKETEHISYNGNLYGIKSIDYHKEADSMDTINIEAVQIPKQNGLINDLAEPFRKVAKEFNNIMFGNKED